MPKRDVARVAITYSDGSVEVHEGENMRHVVHQSYPKGAKKLEDGFAQHAIRWTIPHSIYNKD
jgi:hypothetical protein